ncbi:MAG: signal peptidase I [Alphaproteobacteria bacterium]|nr:signal peptidase I [Alphaproteobacteria bacterium]
MIKKPKNRLREWFDTLFYGILIAIVFRSLFLEPFNIPSGSMIPTLHIGDHIFITKWSYGYSRYSFPFGSWHLWNGRIFKSMPKVGDVIVFRNPKNESLDYVKRLVGLPGDTIQMKEGRLYINGEMVERRDPRPYVVAVLPRSLRSVGYYHENMQIKGNKVMVDGAPANFNYTIEYRSDHVCRTTPGLCGVFPATEYTEVLPNGVEHSIIEYTDNGPMDNTMEFLVPENHLFFMGDNRDNSNDSRADVGFVPIENALGRVWFVWYSHNYASPMVAFWNWNAKMRWNRFGKGIK